MLNFEFGQLAHCTYFCFSNDEDKTYKDYQETLR